MVILEFDAVLQNDCLEKASFQIGILLYKPTKYYLLEWGYKTCNLGDTSLNYNA